MIDAKKLIVAAMGVGMVWLIAGVVACVFSIVGFAMVLVR